mmetsp:Transcript_35570/g.106164  ORF Transcript_35570/g.106164 Transcript_35570/m.106164 type:complete len:131 (-) Transcript_35570:280-672(-)
MPRILSRQHLGPRRSSDPGWRTRRYSGCSGTFVIGKQTPDSSNCSTPTNSSSSQLSNQGSENERATVLRRKLTTTGTLRRAPSVGWGQYVDFAFEEPDVTSQGPFRGSTDMKGELKRESSKCWLDIFKSK